MFLRQLISPAGWSIIVCTPTNWFLVVHHGNFILAAVSCCFSEAELDHCFLSCCLWRKPKTRPSLRWIINWNFAALPLYKAGSWVPLTWALLHRHLLLIINIQCPNLHILILSLSSTHKGQPLLQGAAAPVKCCSWAAAPAEGPWHQAPECFYLKSISLGWI